jgi:hypothetical protein
MSNTTLDVGATLFDILHLLNQPLHLEIIITQYTIKFFLDIPRSTRTLSHTQG